MYHNPKVSVIIIFLNAAEFLREAIESVLGQTYEDWELILVDDGSTDASTQIALSYVDRNPAKVIYIDHPGHRNRGKGASRNLGIHQARGEYVAFLDADDIWLPRKLEQQTAILSSFPKAGMLYGDTLYWYSWTGAQEHLSKDFIPLLGVETNTLISPPKLLPLYIRGKAAVPCTCSIIVRREVIEIVKGFDETCEEIKNYYEDQAFYAKICLAFPVVAVNVCWDKYRQRSSDRSDDIALVLNKESQARKHFLNWLNDYMSQNGIEDIEIRYAIRKELWITQNPIWLPDSRMIQSQIRWIKKWLMRLEEFVLPVSWSRRLWLRN
jgi:glycosyltransferase involved in cell wall biosynthesis